MADRTYTIRPGDCTLSIAARTGMTWQRIWDHPANAELVERRERPNILLPGDTLVVPEREIKHEEGDTEQTHRFRRLQTLVEIRVRVEDHDGPRTNEPYHVEIGKKVLHGETDRTDDDGMAVCRVPATAKRAVLVVGENEDEYELLIGSMDPIDTVTGVHARLENMGFDTGGVGSDYDHKSAAAMRDFLATREVALEERDTNRHDDQTNQDDLIDEYTI